MRHSVDQTGAVARVFFFERLHDHIETLFPSLKRNARINIQGQFHIFVGDVAYLQFWNSISHSHGDDMLRKIVEAFLENFRDCAWVGRIGGDEIALFAGDVEDSTLLQKLEAAQQKISKTPMLAIDVGNASLDDLESFLRIHPFPRGDRIKFAGKVLYDIAMARAQIAKIAERLRILRALYNENDGSFEELFPYAQKGAQVTRGIIRRRFSRMNDETFRLGALNYALTKKRVAMSITPFDTAVFNVARIIFDA
jgi:GGDEF domain-containing protein